MSESESSILREFRVKLETVTPLFLGGAEARGQPTLKQVVRGNKTRDELVKLESGDPELRPPAFRGAMRYWLRALAGGIIGDDLYEIHKIETNVFGSASSEAGKASTIQVTFQNRQLKSPDIYKKGKTTWVTKNGKEIPQPTGYDYLYWSMAESGSSKNNNYQPPKKYFPEGSVFDLVLTPRFEIGNQSALEMAAASTWLLIQFGGVGSRSRRTGGSLSAKAPVEFNGLKFHIEANTVSRIARELLEGIEQARKLVNLPQKFHLTRSQPEFDILALDSDLCQIWVLGPWKTSQEAIETIGASMRDFRTYSPPDHDEVAKWLNGKKIGTVQRAVFGLPIPYKYSNRGPSGVIQGKTSKPGEIDRRASPLWLKISKTADGHYIGVATLFKSIFLPSGEKLYAASVKNESHVKPPPIDLPPDYSLIESWINQAGLSGIFPNAVEVIK